MKVISLVSMAAIAVLGACSHYSEDLASMEGKIPAAPVQMAMTSTVQDIAPAAGGSVSMETMNSALARQYYEMAKYENDKAYDYKAAKQYTQKAMMASKGKVVAPSKISDFDIPQEKQAELSTARGQLISALQTQNAIENQQALASAQINFDCWLERAEEAADEGHYASCKNDFQQAMAVLAMPAAGDATASASTYSLKFVANSAVMDEASKKDIEHVANVLKAPQNTAYTANILGFPGTVQGEFANQLIQTRIGAVRSALIERGVNVAQLTGGNIAMVQQGSELTNDVRVTLNVPVASGPNVQTKTEYVPVTPVQVPAQ